MLECCTAHAYHAPALARHATEWAVRVGHPASVASQSTPAENKLGGNDVHAGPGRGAARSGRVLIEVLRSCLEGARAPPPARRQETWAERALAFPSLSARAPSRRLNTPAGRSDDLCGTRPATASGPMARAEWGAAGVVGVRGEASHRLRSSSPGRSRRRPGRSAPPSLLGDSSLASRLRRPRAQDVK